jgi:hypothetical protein
MVSKNQKLFVARLSGFWLRKILVDCLKKKKNPAKTKPDPLAEVVTYLHRNATIVCGASQHILGFCIYSEIQRSSSTVSQILHH